jgi:hypothetical protein
MLLTKARLISITTLLVLFDALDRVAGYLTLASGRAAGPKNTLAKW